MLTISDLVINIGNKNIISGLSLNLTKAQSLQIKGCNGSGKTTLMRSIIGLVPIYSGKIEFNGDIEHKKHILFLGDYDCLNDSLTVKENLLQLALLNGLFNDNSSNSDNDSDSDIIERIEDALEYWDIAEYTNYFPNALSLGQRKKVILSLINIFSDQKRLFILDEPANALDDRSTQRLSHLLESLITNQNSSIIYSNHSKALINNLKEVEL